MPQEAADAELARERMVAVGRVEDGDRLSMRTPPEAVNSVGIAPNTSTSVGCPMKYTQRSTWAVGSTSMKSMPTAGRRLAPLRRTSRRFGGGIRG